jgi:hypothetical protein
MNKTPRSLGLAVVLSLTVALPTVVWLTPVQAEQPKAKEGWYGNGWMSTSSNSTSTFRPRGV